jgi:hypothetical protein
MRQKNLSVLQEQEEDGQSGELKGKEIARGGREAGWQVQMYPRQWWWE